MPRRPELSNLEFVAPSRAGPVDLAEVIAGHVGPKPVEFFIAETERLAEFLAEQGVIAGRDPDRRKGLDRRVNDQPNPGVDAMSLACEPESFDVVDPDGSEIEHPSTGGGQTVGAVDRTVAGDRREREVDASGSGNGVEESQNGRPAATSVDHLEVDSSRFADRHLRGRELADDRESAWSELTQQHRHDDRRDCCDPDDEELDRTEQPARDHEDDPGDQQPPAGAGRHVSPRRGGGRERRRESP